MRSLEKAPPAWVTLALGSSDELEFLAADDCALHLEHLDRGLYFLGLSRDCDDWGVNLQAHGYIKTKILPNETGAA